MQLHKKENNTAFQSVRGNEYRELFFQILYYNYNLLLLPGKGR
jgi:hypothetical protein